MGEYREIQKIMEGSTVDYATLKVVPRGTPLFPDILMTGQIRFARRLGSNFAVLCPDNLIRLTATASVQASALTVQRILPWFELNAIVTFNGTEFYQILDWSVDATNTISTLVLQTPLQTAQDSTTPASLWATPLVMHADSAQNVSTIVVRSRYQLMNGDVVTFPVSPNLNSLTERNVILAQAAGASGDPEFPLLFSLTLDQPMPITMQAQESQIYMRAYPGYYSPVINVPKLKSPSLMGPFLLDYLSSPLDSTPQYTETFQYRTFDGGGNPVEGSGNYMITCPKNQPVLSRPIWAENMMYWKIIRGSGGFISPNTFRLITDQDGKARVKSDLVPNWPGGPQWTIKVTTTANGTFRVWSEPWGFQDFNITAGITNLITFGAPAGQTIERLDFLAKLVAPGEVNIKDANVAGSVAASFQYGYVFQLIGDSNFEATSVVVKPYFLSLADLAAQYDTGQNYNSWFIYL
jgi:hypothetical protein